MQVTGDTRQAIVLSLNLEGGFRNAALARSAREHFAQGMKRQSDGLELACFGRLGPAVFRNEASMTGARSGSCETSGLV